MRWQYRIEYRESQHYLAEKLAEWGSDGWEACAVFNYGSDFKLILKRPIPEESDETEAYRLLLAHARLCDVARSDATWQEKKAEFVANGYDPNSTQHWERWLDDFRDKALKAARAVDTPHALE